MQLLAAHGANFTRSNALHYAAQREQQVEVLQWLLDEEGFPINQREFEYDAELFDIRSSQGLGTALHCTVASDALECVRFLLERGIDTSLRDTSGRTARERGLASKRKKAVAILGGLKAKKS